jgi:hypothetical protein
MRRNRLAAILGAGLAAVFALAIVVIGRARRPVGFQAVAEEIRNDEIAVERSDVSLSLAGALLGGFAAVLMLSFVAIALIYPSARHGPSDAPRLVTAKPRLEIDPATDLAAFRAQQQGELGGYGWIDRARGVVRIPIDRAMQDVAAAGIKDWPEGAK